ncbi:MAG: ShlB/FhaC/HecB family hemolysin secretion/activation protein [Cyanobacteria bacterium]|nr:ShlB/FhaC/HecB family hemolysin secretion/activation protein [Cyanobacteriota bacterium]
MGEQTVQFNCSDGPGPVESMVSMGAWGRLGAAIAVATATWGALPWAARSLAEDPSQGRFQAAEIQGDAIAQFNPGDRPSSDPNQDRQLGPFLDPLEPPADDGFSPLEPPAAPTIPEQNPDDPASLRFTIRKIDVVGSTRFSAEDLQPLIAPYEGRDVSLSDLQALADRLTQEYLDLGYITSRAFVPPQTITDGRVEIRVLEGSLEAIEIEGLDRLRESYVRSRVELGAGTPLNSTALENQLRLLRADPLLETLEASLRAGEAAGQSILNIRVKEAPRFLGSVGIDNYSPPSVGSERFSANLSYRNPTGIGDELSFAYNRTLKGGTDVLDFGYRVPLNPMNGTLQIRLAPNWNRIVQEPFDEFDIKGETQLYEVSFRQPLVRTPIEEFALSLGIAHQRGQTFVFGDEGTPFGIGPEEDGTSRTTVIKFGQDYIRRDPNGAWLLQSLLSVGTGLLDATQNDGDVPDGQFLSWLGRVQRVQRLSDRHTLLAQLEVQWASEPLLSSQQYVIGGGQTLRGYRQNARSGDNGFRLSIEDRITLARDTSGNAIAVLAPFLDVGYVWNDSDNPNPSSEQRFLVGTGIGVVWVPFENTVVRLDYGLPLVDLDDRGSNIQDSGVYFSINYRF